MKRSTDNITDWPWPAEFVRPTDAWPLSGGMICETVRAQLDDDTDVVAKRCSHDPEIEVDGLIALKDAGAPVPQVLAWSREEDGRESGGVLVLERVAAPVPQRADWAELGEALADLHRTSAKATDSRGDTYGWHRDNRIGRLVQRNAPVADAAPVAGESGWGQFYAQRRVLDHLEDPVVPDALARRLRRVCDGPLQTLLPNAPPVRLVHGDLWSGNVVDGRWMVDPAVHYADRELELAFMTLFGGFPAALFDAYTGSWALADRWQDRRPALQLHHLLVHVRHFERDRPGSYVRAAADRLGPYGW